MRQIKIERAVLIAGEHTEAETVMVVGVDVTADVAGRLVREGCATDATDEAFAAEMTVEPKPEPEPEPEPEPVVAAPAAAEKPAKPAK